jgi:hypothetical protein
MQEVLECQQIRKTRITFLYPQFDGMVERYVKMVLEHLKKVL